MVVILRSLKALPSFIKWSAKKGYFNCLMNKAYIIVAFNHIYGAAGSIYFAKKAQDQVVHIKGDSRQAECVSRLCDDMPEKTKGQLFCQLQVPEQVRPEKEFLYLQVQRVGFF